MILYKACSVIVLIASIAICERAAIGISTDASRPKEKTTTVTPTVKTISIKSTTAAPVIPLTTVTPSNEPLMTLNGTEDGTTCILLKGRFLFSIPYPTVCRRNEYTQNVGPHGSINVGLHDVTSTKGDCSVSSQMLLVEFFEGWEMVIEFGSDMATTLLTAGDASGGHSDVGDGRGDEGSFWWRQFNLTYVYDNRFMPDLNVSINGTATTVSAALDHQFRASRDGSYKCNAETVIHLSDGATLTFSDLQYQAFQTNTTGFPSDNVTKCSVDPRRHDTSGIVPIAVGASLSTLIVILCMAYAVVRIRRRTKKGYVLI